VPNPEPSTRTLNPQSAQEGLLGVLQFCNLMVTGRLEEILDGKKRAAKYPAVDLKHLLVLLCKYRWHSLAFAKEGGGVMW